MSIEDLVLFDSNKAKAGEYDPESFKDGLATLQTRLAETTPIEEIRKVLIELKESLRNYPQIVHELLPEDIGVLVGGIKRTTNVVLVKETAKSNKKKASGNISRSKLAELINKPPEDF